MNYQNIIVFNEFKQSSIISSFADTIDIPILANSSELERHLKEGDLEHSIAPIHINEDKSLSLLSPYEHIYIRYDTEVDENLYRKPGNKKERFLFAPFSNIRLRVILSLLTGPALQGGCDLELQDLKYKRYLQDFFPLHNPKQSYLIHSICMQYKTVPWTLPIEDIREYYGECIALNRVFIRFFFNNFF